MKSDRRSRKMVAVINCVSNHNARAQGAAMYPGINHEVVDMLRKHDVGVIQVPCPEMACLGLQRTRQPGVSIRDALDTPAGRSCCEELSISVADTIEEFQSNGYTVAAVLGGDVKSPGCAVPFPPPEDGVDMPRSSCGVFMKGLFDELHRRGIQIPIRGIRDSARKTMMEDIDWPDRTLAGP